MLKVKKLDPTAPGIIAPAPGNAGYDLCSNEDVILNAFEWTPIRTGIAVELPPGYVGLVRGRSGLAFKQKVFQFDGTVDENYRGEWVLYLKLDSSESELALLEPNVFPTYHINRGDRVAQVVIVPYFSGEIEYVAELSESNRGVNGFGSTGK